MSKIIGYTCAVKGYDYGCTTELEVFDCDAYDECDKPGDKYTRPVPTWRKVEIAGDHTQQKCQIDRYFSGFGGWQVEDPREIRQQTLAKKAWWAREAEVLADALNLCEDEVMIARLIGMGERHPSGVYFSDTYRVNQITKRLGELEQARLKRERQAAFDALPPAPDYAIMLDRPTSHVRLASNMLSVETDERPKKERKPETVNAARHDYKMRTFGFRLAKIPKKLGHDGTVDGIDLERWAKLLEDGYWPYKGEPLPQCVLDALDGQGPNARGTHLWWLDCARIRCPEGEFWTMLSSIDPGVFHFSTDKVDIYQLVDDKLVRVKQNTKLYKKLSKPFGQPDTVVEDLGTILWSGWDNLPSKLSGSSVAGYFEREQESGKWDGADVYRWYFPNASLFKSPR